MPTVCILKALTIILHSDTALIVKSINPKGYSLSAPCLLLCLCLSLCPSICLSLSLSPPVCLSVCLSVYLPLCACVSVCLSVSVCVCVSNVKLFPLSCAFLIIPEFKMQPLLKKTTTMLIWMEKVCLTNKIYQYNIL